MRLTYQYRLFPNSAQRTKLEQTLTLCRWVYNQTLAMRKDAWEQEQRHVTYYDTKRMLPIWKVEKPTLSRVYSQVLQNVTERVELAFQAFFRRVKAGEEEVGYPRFKGYGNYDSFTYTQSGFKLEGDTLALSKIGNVSVKVHRPIVGTVKTLTIRRDSVGNWYACFSCELDTSIPAMGAGIEGKVEAGATRGALAPTHKVVGIDLGLTTFASMSDGTKIDRQRWMKQDAKDIARLQRKKEAFALDTSIPASIAGIEGKKGSPERRKVIRALCHAYERAADRRKNFAHQESRKLVNEYQFIAFEKFDIQEMQVTGNKVIRRNIADVAWGQFVQFTTYKAANAGRGVALVNPRGTTQMCSGRHAIVPKDLSVRVHDCPHCGLKLNRDHNAALNILALGLQSMGNQSLEAQRLQAWE